MTLSCEFRGHRAGSQLENVWKSDRRWEPENVENLKTWKLENFENIKNDPWDMLNNFCFYVYAQKSLFKVENVNAFFWQNFSFMFFLDHISTLSTDITVHRAGSQLKMG